MECLLFAGTVSLQLRYKQRGNKVNQLTAGGGPLLLPPHQGGQSRGSTTGAGKESMSLLKGTSAEVEAAAAAGRGGVYGGRGGRQSSFIHSPLTGP